MNFGVNITITSDGKLAKMIDEQRKKMLLDLHGGLVMRTPVDTGHARAGWTVDTTNGTIENNVEYIEALNHGHSKQASAGFVEAEIDHVTKL